MKITEKDRSQLLRMAGNIATGLISRLDDDPPEDEVKQIPEASAKLALTIMIHLDALIETVNKGEQ
jgi:hypothetical protein